MMKEGSTPSEDRFNECLIWMERIQSSKSRHETHSCDHSVCVLASVIDVCVTKQLWLIALCDSVGEKIIAIISPKNGTMLSILKSSVRSPIVLLIQNPAIVIQSFPCHAEESLKCFLVASEDSIHLIDDCSSTFNLNPSSETISIDSEILIQSFHDSKEMTSFLSSHLLQNKCFPCKDARSNISLDIGVSNGGLSVLNVRDVLLHEIYPKQVKVLSCVAGIITRIQFIPSSQSNVSSSTKKMKVEYIDKYLIDLRDLTYSDTITMYLPASFLTSELCILGMVVYIFNSKLKCSSNCKNIYLEFKLSDSSIGISFINLPSLIFLSFFEFHSTRIIKIDENEIIPMFSIV